MPINLSQFKIKLLDTHELVDKQNDMVDALQAAFNHIQAVADGAAALQISGVTIVDYEFDAFPGEYPEDPETGNAYMVRVPGTIDGIHYPEGSMLLWAGGDWFYTLASETAGDGEWIPVLADADTGGNQAAMTAPAAAQFYRREGRRVTVWFDLSDIDTDGMTGGNELYLIGLPFAAADDVTAVGTLAVGDVTFSGSLSARVEAGEDHIKFQVSESGEAATDLLVSALTTTDAALRGTVTYWAAP